MLDIQRIRKETEAVKRAPVLGDDGILVVNLSGRGDKDLDSVLEITGGA